MWPGYWRADWTSDAGEPLAGGLHCVVLPYIRVAIPIMVKLVKDFHYRRVRFLINSLYIMIIKVVICEFRIIISNY